MLAVGRCPGPACPPGLACTVSFQAAHHPLSRAGRAVKEPQDPRLPSPAATRGRSPCSPITAWLRPQPPGGVLFLFSSTALGRACSVGISGRATSCPAGSDDSHPAKFPLKIHPCRQLSDVCDGNTWLQQQHQPRWRRAGLAPGRRCVPGRPAPCPLKPALQVPPLRVGPSLNPLGKLMVCPSFALLFLELLMGEVTNPPAFLCVPYGRPHGLRTLGRHPPRPSFLYKVLGISSLPLPPEQHLGGRQSVSSLHGSFRPAGARKEAGVLSRPCMCIQRTGVETG